MTDDHISRIEAALEAGPVWTLQDALDARITTYKGMLWFNDPQNSAWTALHAIDAYDIRTLLDRLNKAEGEHKMMEAILLSEQESKRELYVKNAQMRAVLQTLIDQRDGHYRTRGAWDAAREALENTNGK